MDGVVIRKLIVELDVNHHLVNVVSKRGNICCNPGPNGGFCYDCGTGGADNEAQVKCLAKCANLNFIQWVGCHIKCNLDKL